MLLSIDNGVGMVGRNTTKVKIEGATMSWYVEPCLCEVKPKINFDKKNEFSQKNF
jgi:hypothetical protein